MRGTIPADLPPGNGLSVNHNLIRQPQHGEIKIETGEERSANFVIARPRQQWEPGEKLLPQLIDGLMSTAAGLFLQSQITKSEIEIVI